MTVAGQPAHYLSYEPYAASAIMPSIAMGWLTLPRKPEPEVMGEADEVEAYASAAAQAYLDSVDNTLVAQVLSEGSPNTPGVDGSPLSGWLLDIGAGPGGIPLKIVRRCRSLCAVGVDRSLNMVRTARKCAVEQGLAERAVVSSAYVRSVRRLAELAPDLPRAIGYPRDRLGVAGVRWPGVVTAAGAASLRAVMPLRVPALLRAARANVLSLHYALVTPSVVAAAHTLGAPVIAWTVNEPALVLQLAAAGVDALVSDDPRIVVEALATLGPP